MTLDKQKLMYLGAGVLLLLIIVNSTKPLPLKEVQEEPGNKNFDSNSLPITLKPPTRLSDNEPLPTSNLPKKNFFNIAFKPRFDT
jgi:hypothetical protein